MKYRVWKEERNPNSLIPWRWFCPWCGMTLFRGSWAACFMDIDFHEHDKSHRFFDILDGEFENL